MDKLQKAYDTACGKHPNAVNLAFAVGGAFVVWVASIGVEKLGGFVISKIRN